MIIFNEHNFIKNFTIEDIFVCDIMNFFCDFTGDCNFQNDWCRYIDTSTGDFQWMRGKNQTATANTGPTYDHNNDPNGQCHKSIMFNLM